MSGSYGCTWNIVCLPLHQDALDIAYFNKRHSLCYKILTDEKLLTFLYMFLHPLHGRFATLTILK
jgi:hypothetical protein